MSDIVHPFELDIADIEKSIDQYADAVISTLESSFTTIPVGSGFVKYSDFESGYSALRKSTENFEKLAPEFLLNAIQHEAMAFIVIRTILGFTPGEWAHVASVDDCVVSEGYARSLDKRIRTSPQRTLAANEKIQTMLAMASRMLIDGAPDVGDKLVHRLDKADTKAGQASIVAAARLGMPYAMLLYERLLGRPFATVRDANSEQVGDIMEVPIEEHLVKAGISYRKTKHAERLVGFEQAPDFIIPDEFNPAIVIEAKITEDAGTARDKATRIQHLRTLSNQRMQSGGTQFQVIACIDGRGFATRREDMKKIIRATEGNVFTLRTLKHIIDSSPLVRWNL